MQDQGRDYILVCLSSSHSNGTVIRTAYNLAKQEDAKLIALYVSRKEDPYRLDDQEQLQKNLDLAEKVGAMVEILYADDIAYQIIQFAKLYKVRRIVLGRGQSSRDFWHLHKSISDQILDLSDDIDIHIVPVEEKALHKRGEGRRILTKDVMVAGGVLVICTLIGYLFKEFKYDESNILMIYILGVFLIALFTYNEIVSMASSIICVLAFNFFFTQPTLSFLFYNSNYLITFLVLLTVSFLTSRLANRIQKNAENSANLLHVTKILLETNQLLQTQIGKNEIIETGCQQLSHLLRRQIVYFDILQGRLQPPQFYQNGQLNTANVVLDANEIGVATWVLTHNKSAGATTRYLSTARYLYYTIRMNESIYGVIGIYLNRDRLDSVENKVLLAILGDMALALEKDKVIQDKNEVALKAKDEQLRANLLRSISHDLRTPLTTIYGNSDILLHDNAGLTREMKEALYKDIYDDSQWLLTLIENLLSVTRVEDGNMKLKMEPQMVEEVIDEALKHISRGKKHHPIQVDVEDDYLMAQMDVRLIIQVLINLVDNAIKYTPDGTAIFVKAYAGNHQTVIEVTDSGPGISDRDKGNIFQKFYTINNQISDSSRSIGLGLYLCKVIVEAHGGTITVRDNLPHGTIFQMTLPESKVTSQSPQNAL